MMHGQKNIKLCSHYASINATIATLLQWRYMRYSWKIN